MSLLIPYQCEDCSPFHWLDLKWSESQWCPAVCDLMDCSPPGSSVHGILQARIVEWVAMPSSRRSSWPRNQTKVSCVAGRFFTIWATREALLEIPVSKTRLGTCKHSLIMCWWNELPVESILGICVAGMGEEVLKRTSNEGLLSRIQHLFS